LLYELGPAEGLVLKMEMGRPHHDPIFKYYEIIYLHQILDATLEPGAVGLPCSSLVSCGIVLELVQMAADPLIVPFGPHRECEGGHCRAGRQGAAEPVLNELLFWSEDLRMDVDLDVA